MFRMLCPTYWLSGAACPFLPHHHCSMVAPASVCTRLFCVPCTPQYLQHGSILKDSSGKWVLDNHYGVDIIDPSIINAMYQVCFCLRPRRSSLLFLSSTMSAVMSTRSSTCAFALTGGCPAPCSNMIGLSFAYLGSV